MGGGSWSNDVYASRQATRAASGMSAFQYTDQTIKNAAPQDQKVHPSLDPKGVKVRESRDSQEHPNSKAVAVFFDITGSMGNIPRELQTKLPKLMSMILQKGVMPDPQILFGAIGDANSDRAILQVGQFESDIKMEEHLGNIWIEGNGGGQAHESYELAMYFMARHTAMDCLEKRGQKGYLFLMGDELFYPTINKLQVNSVIGDVLEKDLTAEEVVKELQEKFEVFFIFTPSHTYDIRSGHVEPWKKLLPERVIVMEDPNAVCETIAATIAMNEGAIEHSDLDVHLSSVGVDPNTARTVKNALVPLASRNLAKGEVKGDLTTTGSGSGLSSI